MKNREELEKLNESYRKELLVEADQVQEDLVRIAKKALIAGGVVLSINLIRTAFFTSEKKKFKELKNSDSTFLGKELSNKVIVELLSLSSKKLRKFLSENKNDKG